MVGLQSAIKHRRIDVVQPNLMTAMELANYMDRVSLLNLVGEIKCEKKSIYERRNSK